MDEGKSEIIDGIVTIEKSIPVESLRGKVIKPRDLLELTFMQLCRCLQLQGQFLRLRGKIGTVALLRRCRTTEYQDPRQLTSARRSDHLSTTGEVVEE